MDSGPLRSYLLAARLQNRLRRLGKWRRDSDMSEVIKEAEGLVVDVIKGRKPYRSGVVVGDMLAQIGYYNIAQTRLEEYGLREKRMAEVDSACEGVSNYRKRTEQKRKRQSNK